MTSPISGRTRWLGILGDPIAHASAPGLMNARFAARDHQIVINATSLGMYDDDDLPIDPDSLNATMLAAEIVIKPEPTPFLTAALRRGCAVQPGRPMREAQLDLMLQFAGVVHGQ